MVEIVEWLKLLKWKSELGELDQLPEGTEELLKMLDVADKEMLLLGCGVELASVSVLVPHQEVLVYCPIRSDELVEPDDVITEDDPELSADRILGFHVEVGVGLLVGSEETEEGLKGLDDVTVEETPELLLDWVELRTDKMLEFQVEVGIVFWVELDKDELRAVRILEFHVDEGVTFCAESEGSELDEDMTEKDSTLEADVLVNSAAISGLETD